MKDSKIFLVPQIYRIYQLLYHYFGKQYWWPGQTDFEIMVGAILTQNTNWQNVERAIGNLENEKLLNIKKINQLSVLQLARVIKSSGFYQVKARRLKALVKYLIHRYNGDIGLMKKQRVSNLRSELLNVYGIGEETADSILLYALNKPVFVVDAYTKRIFSRHNYFDGRSQYQEVGQFFSSNLPKSVKVYNEYHALLVKLAKDYCHTKPLCDKCPIKGF